MMETVSNNPNIENDELNTSIEKDKELENSLPEMSQKQERFLDLIDADNLLSIDWGFSNIPKISYFGIASEQGILPFNKEGKKIVHEVMSYDEKDNIVNSSFDWENILYVDLLESEINNGQKNIENRRSRELSKVAIEKQRLDDIKKEYNNKIDPLKKHRLEIVLDISIAKRNGTDIPAASTSELEDVNDAYEKLKTEYAAIKDLKFREFLSRRGYKDEKIFEYLDARKDLCGIVYTPEFANKIDSNYYQEWLKNLFKANKNILNVDEERMDGKRTICRVVKRNEQGQPEEYKPKETGYTLEELTRNIIDIVGSDAYPEIEKINFDMTEYITTKEKYDQRKNTWWSGNFAQLMSKKNQIFSRYSEVKRVNMHFDKVLENNVKNSQKKVSSTIVDFKNRLNQKIFNDNTVDELYFLPTGIVAFRPDEKIVKEMPVFDEPSDIFDDTITPHVWKKSWIQYIHQNMRHDVSKLAIGVDIRVGSGTPNSYIKNLFDQYDIKYDDCLIDEKTGYFLPNISLHERQSLTPFVDKYKKFISSVEYNSFDKRLGLDIDDWRKELLKNIKSTNIQPPLFVKEAFLGKEDGLTLSLNNIPTNIDQDVDMFELAVKVAIWNKMDDETKDDYYKLMSGRLNANQGVFVKLFDEFVYNATMRRDLIARLMFLGQFNKWQENKLEDDKEKDFFDRLEQNMRKR